MSRFLPIVWWVFGIVEVISFFYFSNLLTRKWVDYSPKLFTKKLFSTALTIRVVWIVFSYFFYLYMTGNSFEFSSGDALFYNDIGRFGASLISQGNFNFYPEFDKYAGGLGLSDTGYPVYLSFIYFLTGNSIFIVRILKAVWGAWTCLLIFKIASRNFGESVGRIAAIFCMLMPNLIYYTGLHLKEVEMVFLLVAFIERADFLIRNKNYNVINIAVPLVLAGILFTFRTVLGAAALFALATTITFSSNRLIGKAKKMMITVWVLLAIAYFVGGRVATEVEEVWQARTANQDTSLQWRASRQGGNSFSTYASKSVFAPLIFVIPFPTIINTPGQENSQLINGGNYVKNILAFFVMFALLLIIKEKKWRDYLLVGSFTIGYLIVIAMSAFAQSERFHQPALPFLLVFAAYGISRVSNNTKKYFTWYILFIFVAIVAWSWFKLAGRGMV